MTKKIETVPFQFKNEIKDDKQVVTLAGSVARDSWMEESINLKRVEGILAESDAPLVIRLNSSGGDVFEGIAIYNALKDSPRKITIEVTALAASAASLIAMGADEIIMCTGSNMMIHEASTITWGNKHDIQKTLNALETVDNSIVDIYVDKTGKDREEIVDLFKKETWFTADEAVENGLATSVKKGTSVANEILKPIVNEIVANKKLKIFGGK